MLPFLRGCTPWFPLTRPQVDNLPIGPDTSLMEAATQTASTTMFRVMLTSPITPPDWTEEENRYVLVVTGFNKTV